jgi:hypothetical protein
MDLRFQILHLAVDIRYINVIPSFQACCEGLSFHRPGLKYHLFKVA